MSAIKILMARGQKHTTGPAPAQGNDSGSAGAPRPPHLISMSVTCTTPRLYAQETAAFDDLLTRASEPNVFCHPVWIAAMSGTVVSAGKLHPLTCWGSYSDGSQRLLGVWVLGQHQRRGLLPAHLSARTSPFTELSTPVLDDANAPCVLAALLDHIETTPALPRIVHCPALASDGIAARTLLPLLAKTGRPVLVRGQYARNRLDCREKPPLLQTPQVLEAQYGDRLRYTTHTGDDIAEALEEYLAMEAAGWQGHHGTAIICDHASTALLRSVIPVLALAGHAALNAIRLDGKAMRMGLALGCGNRAWLVRTALDEAHAHLNPSRLYVAALNAALLAQDTILSVDSCLHSGTGILKDTWTASQPMLDLMLDVRPQGSLGFDLLQAGHAMGRWSRAVASSLLA